VNQDVLALTITAATLGVVHTALGPDHYLPFAMMARAGGWSRKKTLAVTLACGVAHILSSVVLGALGIAAGLAVGRLVEIESARGEWATYGLVAFGLVYFVWGLRRAWRSKPHTHFHAHDDGTVHAHEHGHHEEHAHVHATPARRGGRMTPWVLFTIFVFGPCEPLIPLLMYPAAQHSVAGVVLVTVVFGAATLATMLVGVLAVQFGLARLPLGPLERYTHALAGAALVACGLAIRWLGA
jgi:ABC-type nickel/cobalt efflux system permease component RcnA